MSLAMLLILVILTVSTVSVEAPVSIDFWKEIVGSAVRLSQLICHIFKRFLCHRETDDIIFSMRM